MAKNEGRDIHLFILMLHHRYSLTIVPYGNSVGLTGGGRVEGNE